MLLVHQKDTNALESLLPNLATDPQCSGKCACSSGSLWSVVFSFGVLSSVGQNLAILPTLTIPMAWFPERRGLVSGLVVSGFGAGAFAFNQVTIE